MILWSLLACGAGDEGAEDSATVPVDIAAEVTSPGPWSAGYAEGSVTYVEPGQGVERALRLALWFPSEATDGDEVRYQGIFEAPGVLGDVAIAPGPWPVVVFSHGHQGYAENSSFLMAHLATHGFVVVAPDHTGNTTWDDPDRTTEIYFQRPLDLGAVLDALPTEPTVGGQVDLDRVVGVGHSFGGYTTYALAGATYDMDTLEPACEAGTGPSSFCSTLTPAYADLFRAGLGEARIDAFVAMAAGDYALFGAAGVAAIERPVLHMTGGLDPGADNEPFWDAADGPEAIRAHLPTAGHQTFTDFSGSLDFVEGQLDPEEGFRAIDAIVLAFARHHTGDPSADGVLDGTIAVSDAVELSFAD